MNTTTTPALATDPEQFHGAFLSEAAAIEIGMLRKGLAKARIEVLRDDDAEPEAPVAAVTPAGSAAFTSAP